MAHNHRLQATHKSASPFLFFQAARAALLCAPEPKRSAAVMGECAAAVEAKHSVAAVRAHLFRMHRAGNVGAGWKVKVCGSLKPSSIPRRSSSAGSAGLLAMAVAVPPVRGLGPNKALNPTPESVAPFLAAAAARVS